MCISEASGIHALLRHLVLFGLAQSKPSGQAQAWTGQAQAELDGATVRVYPAPKTSLWPLATFDNEQELGNRAGAAHIEDHRHLTISVTKDSIVDD